MLSFWVSVRFTQLSKIIGTRAYYLATAGVITLSKFQHLNKPSLNFFLITYEKKIQAWFVMSHKIVEVFVFFFNLQIKNQKISQKQKFNFKVGYASRFEMFFTPKENKNRKNIFYTKTFVRLSCVWWYTSFFDTIII